MLLKKYLKRKYWKSNYRLSYHERNLKKKTINNLIFFYKKLANRFDDLLVNHSKIYTTCFFLKLPQRQYIFSFWDLKNNKIINTSTGKILSSLTKSKSKFLKRSKDALPIITLHFKVNNLELLKNIYLFSIKNFNKRQYDFFKKFCKLIQPNIFYLVHKQSYIPRYLSKRRIKRSVLKLISKD